MNGLPSEQYTVRAVNLVEMVTRSESRSIFLYRNFTFSVIIIQLSSAVLFGKSGFHVTAYFREAEGIEPETLFIMPVLMWAW